MIGAVIGAVFMPGESAWIGALIGGLGGVGVSLAITSTDDRTSRSPAKALEPPTTHGAFEVLASMPIAMLILDAQARVIFATEDAERLLARTVTGQHLSAVFRAPSVLAAVEDAIETGTEDSFDFRVRRPREITLTATLRPLDPVPSRVALLLSDSTGKQLVDDRRSDFVTNASHELRTPLAAISGLLETMRGAAKDDPAAQERFLGIIEKQTDRMIRLVNDLLSLSRVELQENIAPTTPQDIGSILAEVLSGLELVANAAGTEFIKTIPASLPPVLGSRDELLQVFVNLIENAVKYAGSAGPIRVTVEPAEQILRVSVADSGPGIAPEYIPRLTERFFRVEPADSRARGGTGLGLAIVKHIVSRHRGSLDISSKPGQGTTFTVTLPFGEGGAETAS